MAELFQGKNLQKLENGKLVQVDNSALEGKKVALYFSAHWCPPCRGFTPVLKKFYEDVKAQDKGLEIVFITSDSSPDAQVQYMKEAHGSWLTLAHGDPFIAVLKQKYGISGIPTLVIINSKGDVITKNARADVMQGVQTFDSW